MWIRPLDVDDAAWLSPLAERAFARGYGEAVARWVVDPSAEAWAAEVDGRPLGFALVSRIGVVEERGAHVAELAALAVDPDLRRRGTGRALLAAVMRNVRTAPGFRYLQLLVAEENLAARALFAQAGFEDLGPDGTYETGEPARRMRWRPRAR